MHQHANLGALTILADGFILRDSIVRDTIDDARGILIAEASNVLIEGNTIYNNPRDGIRLADCSGVTLRANHILDNGSYGVKLMNCANSFIEGNVFLGNSYVPESPNCGAIFLEFGTKDITVSKNEIFNNKRHVIVMHGDSGIKIHDNTIRGNSGYGIYVYGASNENEIYNNFLLDNRLEGIYIEATAGKNNNVHGNEITFPRFNGTIADFEKVWPEDYHIHVLPDESAAEISFSFPENASYDGSRALRIKYIPYADGSQFSIFCAIGQDWSGYEKVKMWVKPDRNEWFQLEFGEHDGDVWCYGWSRSSLEVGRWNSLESPISAFRLKQRSIGDGELNLKGIAYSRLELYKLQSTNQQGSILFDNIHLGH